jgi:hypothetical protein
MPAYRMFQATLSRLTPRIGLIESAVLAALLVLSCAGCAKLTAAHLALKPWQDGGSQSLTAKFMQFDFQTLSNDDKYEVKGTAFTIPENLPFWVDSVDNLSITAYLCDEHGNVLAHDAKNYPSQKITATGFAFDLLLKYSKNRPSGGCYVAFGYRGMFSASRPPAVGDQGGGDLAENYVFFVSEQAALTK